MVRLATFNDNVQVVHIGHLFRNSGHKEWRILFGLIQCKNGNGLDLLICLY